MLVATLVLGVIYLWLWTLASGGNGWGNGGSGGGIRSWGRAETYYDRSNRAGSPSGSNVLGGGPESGK